MVNVKNNNSNSEHFNAGKVIAIISEKNNNMTEKEEIYMYLDSTFLDDEWRKIPEKYLESQETLEEWFGNQCVPANLKVYKAIPYLEVKEEKTLKINKL